MRMGAEFEWLNLKVGYTLRILQTQVMFLVYLYFIYFIDVVVYR